MATNDKLPHAVRPHTTPKLEDVIRSIEAVCSGSEASE
ncbi:MAG: hypothetical protein QOE85_823 [Actinomycetota bacterium]|jgi:hypothetical protein|nr:hypothetical protein [Actinomycetota bacterium]MDQ1561482.1 hypothetical protein [Actinomycetota bacterium]MDQ1563291.1 hypothetical protein [Actinomycetota bacterium]